MKLITRDTDYAVRALCYMAVCGDEKGVVSVRDMVKEIGIPRPFLRKILQMLNKKTILKSFKGQGGGFKLALPPNEIFLVDVIETFQGPLKINECIFKKKVCPDLKVCVLKKKIDEIENYVEKQLESITIGSLING